MWEDGGDVGQGFSLAFNPATGSYEIIDTSGKFIPLGQLGTVLSQGGVMGQGGGLSGIIGTIGQGLEIASEAAQTFGSIPGEFSKFASQAYPLMHQQAQASGLPVYAFWFNGQVIMVLPNGQYGTVVTQPTLQDAYNWWGTRAQTASFYVLVCGGPGTPLLSGCSFQLYGSGNPADVPYSGASIGAIGGVGTASISGLWLLLILGGVVLLFVLWGGKK